MKIKGLLSRRYSNSQTTGHLVICNQDEKIFECETLELPYNGNKRNISCIPLGDYKVIPHMSPTFGKCFKVLDVPGRSDILIHPGNYYTDIKGCIAIGATFKDINNDSLKDVILSKPTIENMVNVVTEEFLLMIR